ncbi:hypothetical protein BP5796_05405 [Coleophoma crateriformis]|uniref:Transcription factor CBF/NF-Y/archaeal histone domain-containing protein n=1 Tax=Coleophoma crateriformis TaxID=565419 RepID=A0A3D8S321_9HELO|nr:hypothetical protein BP5796_05405 [Coleophoma crateriformis]
MPYNSSAIPPRRDVSGTCQLPLSRVKKIIALDQDINMCSNNAAFVITLATELFIQYMAEQGHNVVKSERKPRRNIQYRDLSNAVSHQDNMEFLVDVVPKTVPYKQVKEAKTPASRGVTNGAAATVERGQTTIDGSKVLVNGSSGNGVLHEGEDDSVGPSEQLEIEIRGQRTSIGEINGTNGAEDVEMS